MVTKRILQWIVFLAVAAMVPTGGCRTRTIVPAADSMPAEPWPAADRLFHRDPRWLGSDAAFSIPMADGRILWLFGDTFVANTPANLRSQSRMVRNTIGIQSHPDPTTADMTFYWRGTGAEPASYFPEDGDRWFWPQHGIDLGNALVIFLERVKARPGQGLGFEADGWSLAIIERASSDPANWTARLVSPRTVSPMPLVVGAALNLVGEYVISLAIREPGDHAGYLLRWRRDDLAAGQIDAMEWWTGERGWAAAGPAIAPSTVMDDAGAESSLHFERRQNRWVHVTSQGFGASTIVVSFAEKIEGPWSKPIEVFRPPESDRLDAFVYAAKAHPELSSDHLVITYASNTMAGVGALVADTSLYYPRFVRLSFRRFLEAERRQAVTTAWHLRSAHLE